MEKFLGEQIEVEKAETSPRPLRFTWHGEVHDVVEVLGERVDTGYGGLPPRSRKWYTRRHRRYFVVKDAKGDVFEIYLDYSNRSRQSWWLVTRFDKKGPARFTEQPSGEQSMDLSTFLTRKDLILLDGAMGTQLAERGAIMEGQSNLSHPDTVFEIHKDYAQCGCHILITNTLTINRISVERHKVRVDVREVNVAGVKLAKQAAGQGQYILGDMGSTGKLLEPYGNLTESAAYDAFVEQAALLAEEGVDGFAIETMIDLKEALCALRACKEVSALPVIASMAFSTPKNGGRTIMGNKAHECAQALTEAGAQAVGANCGDIDPFEMAEIVSTMRSATNLPILAKPNAGKPRLVDNKTVFDMSPPEFAKGIRECISAGATMVGGCCGTSPEHICALADAIIKGNRRS